jgi:hypothetical protein
MAQVMEALGTWGSAGWSWRPSTSTQGSSCTPGSAGTSPASTFPTGVVVHFRFPGLPKKGGELWIIFDGERSEVCRKDPGFEVELFVQAEPGALAEWHVGRIEWADALRAERIRVLGPAALARALPTWNRRSPAAQANRTTVATG